MPPVPPAPRHQPTTVSSRPDTPAETPDLYGAYPTLSEAQITRLGELGERRPTEQDEILFREGQQNCDFFVVLAGKVAVVEGHGTPEERIIAVHGPGRFLDELSLLTGEASYYTAVVAEPGEVLAVPLDRLRDLVARDPDFGDLILRAYLIRRSILIGLGVGLRVVGSRYSPDARRLRDFAARNRLPYRWLDLEADPAADELLRQFGVAPEDTPIVIVHGRLLRNPSNAELAAATGLPAPTTTEQSDYDLLVVGAGPAGLSAGVYGASEGMRTAILDAVATGGQAGTSSRIENYLGFPSGVSGAELAERAVIQARKFGATFAMPALAASISRDDGRYRVGLDDGTSMTATSVVIATGASYRRLSVPGMDSFEKMCVYYAASQAEAMVCRGDPVAVVGGGNSAGQATVFLSRQAERVSLIVREAGLGENMSRYLIDQITRLPNVRILLSTEVRELLGADALEAVAVENNRTGARQTVEARALFVFIGVTPCTGWLGGLVELDDHGFVRTGPTADRSSAVAEPEAGSQRSALETSQPGVFAVGDVRSGSTKRVATAVGEGAMAISLAFERARAS
jgi:thioredoxin reductase (NADPH)